ncbi:MAG TPA: hypothetical protein VMI94_09575 [Bryobacteraceae bacterium]|nr:hypothetical protein [Bryobacteraceae bacterium]
MPAAPARPNLLTAAAIGAVACVAADMVHEGLGHGIASWITGDPILSFSTVALQNAAFNRFVSAAGTSADCLAGILALLALRRMRKFSTGACFLWIFGAFSLLNVGYLTASAITGGSDWANVISGLSPAWLWRAMLGLAGAALYVAAARWIAASLLAFVDRGELAAAGAPRLVLPAYLAGGAVMTLAAVFNPIGPSLILLSGAGASFGLNAGLLWVSGYVRARAPHPAPAAQPVPFSAFWIVLAIAVSAFFIGVMGPGIRFSR